MLFLAIPDCNHLLGGDLTACNVSTTEGKGTKERVLSGVAIEWECASRQPARGTHMHDSNPGALFTYVAQQLNRFGLAYIHVNLPSRCSRRIALG
jgi:hypothetical protein